MVTGLREQAERENDDSVDEARVPGEGIGWLHSFREPTSRCFCLMFLRKAIELICRKENGTS